MQRLDSESEDSGGSESRSAVDDSELELNGVVPGMYAKPQEQAFAPYRHLLMPCIDHRNLTSLKTSVSGSEDNASITSYESEAGAKSAVFYQTRPSNAAARLTVSDTEGSRRSKRPVRPRRGDVYLSEGMVVSKEELALRIRERLVAVAKDRETMTLKARDLLRQHGKSYEEIMSTQWYDLPETCKYLLTDDSPRVNAVPQHNGTLHPPSNHHVLSPLEVPSPADPNTPGQLATPQPGMPMRDVEEAMKEWHLSNQQVPRKRHSHRQTSVGSSVLSAASDSGVGGDTWAANDLTTPANTDRLHDYVQRQNTIHSRLPERERTAHAAAIALISNSPKPDSLSPYPGLAQQQRDMERQQQQQRRQVGHFSSNDDSSSVFTITSQSSTSDLFIPRRTQRQYADSDDQQHFSNRSRRPLTTPKSSRSSHIKNSHTPSPLAEQHRQIPPQQNQRAAPQMSRGDPHNTLIMYTLGELPTPFAKRLSGAELTLKDFKERVFARKGEYRFFFKYFCADVNMELFEEFSDDLSLLPLLDGKIVGRVEKLPMD